MSMKQKNSKWPTQKNSVFQNQQFSIFFHEKFHGMILGLVGLIDAKGIDVATYNGREAVRHKLKNGLKHKKCI